MQKSANIAIESSTAAKASRRPLAALLLAILGATIVLISPDITATNEIPVLGQAITSEPQTATTTNENDMPTDLRRSFMAAIQEDASPEYDVTAEQGRDGAIYQAFNPVAGISAGFDNEGIQVNWEESGSLALRMKLSSYGYDGHTVSISPTGFSTAGNRVEYRYGGLGLTEWYLNGPMGLEQGFTLDTPPAGPKNREVRLDVTVSGGLTPVLDADEDGITFTTADGSPVISYNGLYAYDATGSELPAHLVLTNDGFAILVDDTYAVYPVTIDPWVQQQKLEASDAAAGSIFGYAVAISGDTAVFGAPSDDTAAGTDAGSAYVFTRSGSTWTQQQKLEASDAAANDYFGVSVAIDGDTLVVGASFDDTAAGTDAGSAYVFTRSGSTWTQQQKLEASDAAANDHFGLSVAISGDTAVIGARWDETAAGTGAGSAYVFTRSGSTWTQQQKLEASDAAANDQFGYSVAVSGDTVVVGGTLDDTAAGADAGSAYVFTRSGSTWTQQQKLEASDAAANDQFGWSVAVSGNTAVIGAYAHDTAAGANAGSAYVFYFSYNEAPSDSVGLSDSVQISVAVSKDVSDSLGMADAVSFDYFDTLGLTDSVQLAVTIAATDVLPLTDSAQVAINTSVSDSLEIADALSFDYFETLGLTESVQVVVSIAAVESVSLTDSAQVAVSKVVSNSLGVADSVGLGLPQSDSLGVTESVQLVVSLAPSEALSLTESAQIAVSKNVSDTLGLADAVSFDYFDSLGLMESAQVAMTTTRGDTVSLTDSVQLAIAKGVADSIVLTDLVVLGLERSDSLSLAETARLSISKVVADALGLTDSVHLAYAREAADSIGLGDSVVLGLGKADSLSLTETAQLSVSKAAAETVNLTDSVQLATADSVMESIGLTDSVVLYVFRGDSLSLTETAQVSVGKSPVEAVSLTESVQLATANNVMESIGLTDSVTLYVVRGDSLSLTESASLATNNAAGDSLGLTDSVLVSVARGVADSMGVTEKAQAAIGKTATDSLGLTDSVTLYLGKADALSITETAKVVTGKAANDTMGLADTVALDLSKADALSITETAQATMGKAANDAMGVTDTVALDLGKAVGDGLSVAETVALELTRAGTDYATTDAIALGDSVDVSITRAPVLKPPEPAPAPSDDELASEPQPAARTLTKATYHYMSVTDNVTLSVTHAESVGANARLTEAVQVATGKTVEDGLGLTDSVSIKTTLKGAEDLGVADSNAEAWGQAIVRLARIDLEAAGRAIVEAATIDAEATRQGIIEAVRIDSEITHAALDAGVADDADALAVLGTAVNVDAFLTEAAPVEGIDPVSGAFWANLGSSGSIVQVFAQFAAPIPDAAVTIDHSTSLPEGVQPFTAGEVVNQYVRITPQHFQEDDIKIAHLTFSVENSWLAANGIHPWGIQINRYDEATGIWKAYAAKLVGQDEESVYYTVAPDRFSLWAVSGSAEVPPTRVMVDNLRITHSETTEGQNITLQAQVTNLGTTEADYNAVLWVNERAYASQAMTVPVGVTVPVAFTLQLPPGSYATRFGRLSVGLEVRSVSADIGSEVSSLPGAPQSPEVGSDVEPEAPSPIDVPQSENGEPPFRPGFAMWLLMAGVPAGVLLGIPGLTSLRLRNSRRSKR